MNMAAMEQPANENSTKVFAEPVLNVSTALREDNSKSKQGICYVKSFDYGGEELKASVPGFNPMDNSEAKIVGLKGNMDWNGCGSFYYFDMYVDSDGKAAIEQRNLKQENIVIKMDFELYKYDHSAGKYYKAVWMDQPLEAVLASPVRPYTDDSTPNSQVNEVDMFRVQFAVLFKNDSELQKINVASNEGAKGVTKASLARG